MKAIKRLTALLLVLVMMFTIAPMAFAASDFTDVSKSDWFYAPVNWAVNKGITGGIGNNMFGPNNDCTREQVVTFLWADAGKPEPTTTVSPFTDVTESDWFFKPVMWAVENGITSGLTPTEFGTGKTCTRAQVATFLWAVAGKPAFGTPEKGFLDVAASDWYYNPVMWAVENGITSGIGNGNFGPNNNCTRAQIATFMYAASPDYVKPEPAPTPVPTPTPKPTPAPITNEDRIEIAAAYVERINSVDGVDIAIYWRNNTGKEINYIHFNCYALDLNGNILKNDFCPYYYDLDCWLKGPITTDNKDMSGDDPCTSGLYYSGLSAGGKPNFAIPDYDEEFDADYYYSYDNTYGRKIYIDPANANHTYMGTHWEAIIYNGRASDIRIHSVKIEYADGTVETIRNPKVGPRTSPEKDVAYTEQMKNSLGCDVVGHDANPTCTESDICKRCYTILPATGHTYKYSATCTSCGFRYEADLELYARNLPEKVVDKGAYGGQYTFEVIDVFRDYEEDPEVDIEDGMPVIDLWLYTTFRYEKLEGMADMDSRMLTLRFYDENDALVLTEEILVHGSESSEWFNITLPGNGVYYVDVTAEVYDPF